MVDGVSSLIQIPPVFAVQLLLYGIFGYHGAVELFVFLDDLLVVQPSNFPVVDSKASHRSWHYKGKVPSRQSLENHIKLITSLFLDADHSVLLIRANLQDGSMDACTYD